MAITNVTSGSALDSVTTTLALIAPTVAENDIMIACIYTNDNTASISTADWAQIRQDNNTATMRGSLFWKRAGSGDSGSTNNFTIAGTTVGFGVICAWRGVARDGNPIGNVTASINASSATVTFATLTPSRAHGAVVAIGLYANDLSSAGAIAGTDPTFANVVDAETPTGNDASIFVYWAVATGIATGARSFATGAVASVNIGYLVELLAQNDHVGSSGSDGAINYPRLNRQQL